MNSVFSEQILGDKLSKLNSTQQCIETLSHWCIFHRSKAELVVRTWDKQFHSSEMAQKVPLLYLANDILQNSKRKGNEFVSEFWKVLPAALKDVLEKGDEHGKTVISRLVHIWEQRRVFGSRARSLKEVMLGNEEPPPLEFNKKRSRSVRIVKRDSRSIRTKLSIGGAPEKIVSAFHSVLSELPSEDVEMRKCKTAVQRIRKMEKDVDSACSTANDSNRKTLANDLEEEENSLKQSIEKLKSVEASRVALVSQLEDALREQESDLENVRTQMQVAQAQAEEATDMRKRLNGEDYATSKRKSGEKPKKSAAAIAAEVADKLTASTSSQLIMTSVLSTFAAEESSKTNGLTNTTPTPSNSMSKPPDKLMPAASDPNVFMPAQPLTPHHSYQTILVPQQISNSQAQYQLLPPNGPSQQYLHPYGYGSVGTLPSVAPPPPPPAHMVGPMVPLNQQMMHQVAQQQQQPSPMSLTHQAPAPPSFRPLQPPGMVYYGNLHHAQ